MFEEKIAELNHEIESAPIEDLPGASKTVYTPEEIQNILGISKPTVYKLLKQEQFRILHVGRCMRVPKAEFDHWLDGCGAER